MGSFLNVFKIMRGGKEDYREVGESKKRVGYRTVNEIMCSLLSDYGLFQRCVNLDAQKE